MNPSDSCVTVTPKIFIAYYPSGRFDTHVISRITTIADSLLCKHNANTNGVMDWYRYDKFHRGCDISVAIRSDGVYEWYQGGKLHRYGDEPITADADDTYEWYRRDRDQPAIIRAHESCDWYQRESHSRDYSPITVVNNWDSKECRIDGIR